MPTRADDLDDPHVGAVFLVHWMTVRPGIDARSNGQPHSAAAQITMPQSAGPRWRGRSCIRSQISKIGGDAAMMNVKPGCAELTCNVSVGPFIPTRLPISEAVYVFRIETQHFPHFARGGLSAIGNNIGGHRRAESP